jgi:hypothetical protein
MTGPIGIPTGPQHKWLIPWYAAKMLAVLAWGLIGAAVDATREARRRK